jgi:hypothetical protein
LQPEAVATRFVAQHNRRVRGKPQCARALASSACSRARERAGNTRTRAGAATPGAPARRQLVLPRSRATWNVEPGRGGLLWVVGVGMAPPIQRGRRRYSGRPRFAHRRCAYLVSERHPLDGTQGTFRYRIARAIAWR